ncbi:MAG TPA: cytochrome b/b6 domain-containing protein [Thermodesulfovibrionales bacterium]|nr:cytochrome b/b6 domain-containing protein [Thermodesulfovibrionales bacterium]
MTKEKAPEYYRFNLTFRLQHIILMVTFILLAFTGWAMKYPEPTLEHASWLVRMWGGAKMAGLIHRIAGVTMIFDFIWHVLYLFYLLGTGKTRFHPTTTIVPVPSDIENFVMNIRYFLGLSSEKPRFGRFNYLQKFDYWAVFWGMGIIGLSGLALAFPIQAQHLFPQWSLNWIWELLSVLHSDEALLAIVFILFIHFYNEHLTLEKFPMHTLWITGRMPVEEWKHEHPLEYELERKENPGSFENRKGS